MNSRTTFLSHVRAETNFLQFDLSGGTRAVGLLAAHYRRRCERLLIGLMGDVGDQYPDWRDRQVRAAARPAESDPGEARSAAASIRTAAAAAARHGAKRWTKETVTRQLWYE